MKIAAAIEKTVMVKLTCICDNFKADCIAGNIGISMEFPNVIISGMDPMAVMTMPLLFDATCFTPNYFTFNGGGTIQPFSFVIFKSLSAYSAFCVWKSSNMSVMSSLMAIPIM